MELMADPDRQPLMQYLNGGIIGVNGSAFDYGTGKHPPCMCIKNGIIYGDYMTSYSVMAVKKDGTIYTPAQGLIGKKSSCSRCKRYI